MSCQPLKNVSTFCVISEAHHIDGHGFNCFHCFDINRRGVSFPGFASLPLTFIVLNILGRCAHDYISAQSQGSHHVFRRLLCATQQAVPWLPWEATLSPEGPTSPRVRLESPSSRELGTLCPSSWVMPWLSRERAASPAQPWEAPKAKPPPRLLPLTWSKAFWSGRHQPGDFHHFCFVEGCLRGCLHGCCCFCAVTLLSGGNVLMRVLALFPWAVFLRWQRGLRSRGS